MRAALATALRESCGYLQDEGWHQTAQLMTLAADEIDRLNARVQDLEAEALRAPAASNQNVARAAIAAGR